MIWNILFYLFGYWLAFLILFYGKYSNKKLNDIFFLSLGSYIIFIEVLAFEILFYLIPENED